MFSCNSGKASLILNIQKARSVACLVKYTFFIGVQLVRKRWTWWNNSRTDTRDEERVAKTTANSGESVRLFHQQSQEQSARRVVLFSCKFHFLRLNLFFFFSFHMQTLFWFKSFKVGRKFMYCQSSTKIHFPVRMKKCTLIRNGLPKRVQIHKKEIGKIFVCTKGMIWSKNWFYPEGL